MRNNSVRPLTSTARFNRAQRFSPAFLAVACAIALVAVGCKKESGGTAGADKDATITGKPTDAPVSITPSWKSGNKYLMRLERAQSSELGGIAAGRRGAAQGNRNNNAPIDTMYAQEYTLFLTNADGGNRGAEMEITGIELQAGRGEETFLNYDSQNKAAPRDQNNPIATAVVAALDKLIGGKIHYLLGADGKVQKVEGVKELLARADGTNAQAGRGFGPAMFLRQAINEDTFKQMIELNGAPDKEMKIGESWPFTREVDAPMIGKLSVIITNTLRGWQNHEGVKCARVEFSGIVTSTGGNNTPRGGRIGIENGQVSGHYWYDPAIGLSREMQLNQSYTVSGIGVGGGRRNTNNAAATNSFSAPIKETISVKLLEVRPQE